MTIRFANAIAGNDVPNFQQFHIEMALEFTNFL